MENPSSNGIENTMQFKFGISPEQIFSGLIALLSLAALVFLLLNQPDPYIQKTLLLKGSVENGGRLFKMNCVGCHGISAQGLVGPELNKISKSRTDKQIINQVLKGLTPPMPSFEIEEQSMADLLSYLHSLD